MKTIKPLLLSLVILSACSNEKPIDKQAIIQAFKDSVTLDSLKKSKLVKPVVKKSSAKIVVDSSMAVSSRSYSNKDYNSILAFKAFYDKIRYTSSYSNLPDSVQVRLDVFAMECEDNLEKVDKRSVNFDKELFDHYYNGLLGDLGKYIDR